MFEFIAYELVALIVCVIFATLLLLILFLACFIAGGNWLEEESEYVPWRHYVAVKLHIRKPRRLLEE